MAKNKGCTFCVYFRTTGVTKGQNWTAKDPECWEPGNLRTVSKGYLGDLQEPIETPDVRNGTRECPDFKALDEVLSGGGLL